MYVIKYLYDKYGPSVVDNSDYHGSKMSTNHPPNHPPLQPQTPGRICPSSRTLWRTYFHDHPKLTIDKIQSSKTGKPKLYCKECFASHIEQLRKQDVDEVNTGRRVEVRDDGILTNYSTSAQTIEKPTSLIYP